MEEGGRKLKRKESSKECENERRKEGMNESTEKERKAWTKIAWEKTCETEN